MIDEQKLVLELRSLIGSMQWLYFIDTDEEEGRIDRFVRLFQVLVECGVDINSLTALKGLDDGNFAAVTKSWDAALKKYEDSLLPDTRADEQRHIQEEIVEKREKDYPHKGSDALWDFFNTF